MHAHFSRIVSRLRSIIRRPFSPACVFKFALAEDEMRATRQTSCVVALAVVPLSFVVFGCGDGQSLGDAIAAPSGVREAAHDSADQSEAYQDRLNESRAQRLHTHQADFFTKHGKDKSVEVVVTGVNGDPAAASTYLRKKLFKAAYEDYANASSKAKQQTEANKKAAGEAAVTEHTKTWGEGVGPSWVRFQYKVVESDLPYPAIEAGAAGGGTYTFYASPVLDLNAFAKRYDVGRATNVDAANRKVTIQAVLPTPIPDFDVEEMIIQHGADNVATLIVKNAVGDERAVGTYLGRQAAQLDPKINLYVVGPKPISRDSYEMTVAPVGDLQVFSDRIRFGQVTALDPTNRTVTLSAELPNPLPTAALASANSTGRAGETKKLSDWSDFDKEPLEGETTIDWALRIVKGNGHYADRALAELASMPADPKEHERVAEVLNATFTGNGFNVDRHIDAIVNWKTPEGAQKIADIIADDWAHHSSDKYLAAIKRMDMPAATDAAADAIRRKILDDRGGFGLEKNLTALERLERPDVAVAALKILVERDSPNFGNKEAIQGLTRFKTPQAAEVIASQIGHKWVGNEASVALRQMGEHAEPIAIRMLTHRAPLVRAEAANILYDVGTQQGVDALSAAISREKEAAVKVHLRDARKALVQKLQASGGT
jgi:hypothetical protein